MRMTQKQFCRRFGFSLGTLRHWERGDRRPRGTALMLLTVVRHNPRAVVAALGLELRRNRFQSVLSNPPSQTTPIRRLP